MFGTVVVILLLGTAGCNSDVENEKYELLGAFQEFTASTALILPTLNVSSACLQQSRHVLEEAQRYSLWALKILDSTAKVPSGILNGNLNQFGDFDLCLNAGGNDIRSRYCLADFSITPKGEHLKEIDDRMHGYRSMSSEINDPGQRLPKLGSWRWGLCIPNECSAKDLDHHLNTMLSQQLDRVAYVEFKVDPDLCYTAERETLGFGHYITIIAFCLLGTCIICGSMPGYSAKKSTFGEIVQCFSLQNNWARLIKLEPDGDDIPIVHGTRALNALALLISHKQMAYFFNPFVNTVRIGEKIGGTWSMIGRSAILYTDSFILVSGLLSALPAFKEVERNGKINFKRSLISRYLRFTPNLLFLILTCTYLMDFIGAGPLWGQVVSKYSNYCKSNMWRNFLYIHNYFGFDDMCLTHTHQLGIDMQLFFLTPILVYMLWKHPKLGLTSTLGIVAVSSWLRYSVTIAEELSTVIYYGVPVQRLFKTAKYSYILPTHRATVYCFGILLAYALRKGVDRLNMSTTVATLGWTFASAAAVFAVFGPSHMAQKGYVYKPEEAAFYNSWGPILWCSFLVWSAIACWNNKGGFFNSILTWKYFIIFSRISYSFYLVQFPVFFYNVGTNKTSHYYGGFYSLFNIEELFMVFALSVLLTLTVDIPFQNLKRTFMPAIKEKSDSKCFDEETKMDTAIRRTNHG